jgi:hypothetical protein
MKKIVTILITGSCILVTLICHSKEVPTEAQLQQLFQSIARVVPEKARVISLYVQETAPPSEAEVKKIEDLTRAMDEKVLNSVPEPLRTQRIEEHIRLVKSAMTGEKYEKIQEWKSGSLYRMDEAVGWYSLEEAEKKTNYDTTHINLVNTTNGENSIISINNDTKSFESNDNKPQLWSQVNAWNAMIVEDEVAFVVGMNLASTDSIRKKAKDEHQKLLIDQGKLRWLLAGQNPNVDVYLDEKTIDGQQLDEFKFGFSKMASKASVLIECVKTNYNRITRTEITGTDGGMVLSSIRKSFDSQDFPHEYTLIENRGKGYFTNTFLIREVELNAHFSDDEVFRFAPGTNYNVWDMSTGKPKNVSWAGGIKPSRIIDISIPLKKSNWFENSSIIRILVFVVILLPPIVLILMVKRGRYK